MLDDPNVSRFHAEVAPTDGDASSCATSARATARASTASSVAPRRARARLGDRHRPVPARLRRRAASSPATTAARCASTPSDVDDRASGDKTILDRDVAVHRARRARGDHRRERLGQEHADQGAGRRDRADRAARSRSTASRSPSRLTDIGYVPQDEIVHRRADRARGAALRGASCACRRRLERADIDGRGRRACSRSSRSSEHADTRIGSLSGGQRKRAGVAAELLSRPSLLFLDEPTTGLDPGLETRMMELLRELADERARGRRGHARDQEPRPLRQGRGHGPRRRAVLLRHARRGARASSASTSYDDIYRALDERPAAEWRRRVRARRARASRRPEQADRAPIAAPRGAPGRAPRGPRDAARRRRAGAPLRAAVHARPAQPR